MGNPSSVSVHVNRPLTNISVAYANAAANFVADKVFPIVPVTKQGDKYFTYTKSYWFRGEAALRAPGAESKGSGYELSTTGFYCDVVAVHKDIPDQIRANMDEPLDADRDATRWVTNELLVKRDIDWASAFFATSKWTGSSSGSDITPSTTWDNDASTPVEDIRKEARSILEKTGVDPNALVMVFGKKCFDDVIDHPDVLDRIKHSAGPGNPAVANEAALARVFGIGRVLQAKATKNTAAEAATASMDFIAGERNALLVYAAPSPSLMDPSGGYIFSWTGYLGAGAGAPQISRYRMDLRKADRVEGEMAYDMKQIAADVGAFFSNAVAS